jgi:Na+/H+ antiporter NhaD/arsenite permease-like protein
VGLPSQLGLGRNYPGLDPSAAVARLIVERVPELAAISAGAVFMGACTYIGNAPNFMVKSIAEESGVEMPSFFGYIFNGPCRGLVPTFALATWFFH